MVNSKITSDSDIEHDFPSLTEKHHKETKSQLHPHTSGFPDRIITYLK